MTPVCWTAQASSFDRDGTLVLGFELARGMYPSAADGVSRCCPSGLVFRRRCIVAATNGSGSESISDPEMRCSGSASWRAWIATGRSPPQPAELTSARRRGQMLSRATPDSWRREASVVAFAARVDQCSLGPVASIGSRNPQLRTVFLSPTSDSSTCGQVWPLARTRRARRALL